MDKLPYALIAALAVPLLYAAHLPRDVTATQCIAGGVIIISADPGGHAFTKRCMDASTTGRRSSEAWSPQEKRSTCQRPNMGHKAGKPIKAPG